jgi:hypothetical protein
MLLVNTAAIIMSNGALNLISISSHQIEKLKVKEEIQLKLPNLEGVKQEEI